MLKVFAMIIFNLTAMVMFVLTMLCAVKDLWLLAASLFVGGLMCTKFMYELAEDKKVDSNDTY